MHKSQEINLRIDMYSFGLIFQKKKIEPCNQVVRLTEIPCIKDDATEIKVLVGKYKNLESSIKSHSPLLMLDIFVKKSCTIEIPSNFSIGIYVLEGVGKILNERLSAGTVIVSKGGLTKGNDSVEIEVTEPIRLFLFGGEQIKESLTFDGFFTCCSEHDMKQAISDFEKCDNAFKLGKGWTSKLSKNN